MSEAELSISPDRAMMPTLVDSGLFAVETALAGKSSETKRKYVDWLRLFYHDVLKINMQNPETVPIEPFLNNITPAAVEAWLGKYADKGHSRSGLGQARAAIVFMARALVLAKQAPSNLWHDLKLVTLPSHAATAAYGESAGEDTGARWLAPDEVKVLIDSAGQQKNEQKAARDVSLIWLVVTLGMRRDEVSDLKWNYLTRRGKNWVLRIRGKRNKWRAVGVPPETVMAIQPWAKMLNGGGGMPEGYILRRVLKNGRIPESGITGNAVWRIVTDAWKSTGLQGDLAPHDLRRTAAAIALEAGANEREIQAMLGHSSIETTHRYLAPLRENTATYRIASILSQQQKEDDFFGGLG